MKKVEKEIGIDDFVEMVKRRLDEWVKDYKMNNEKSPKYWPLNRRESEWDEDFGFWEN